MAKWTLKEVQREWDEFLETYSAGIDKAREEASDYHDFVRRHEPFLCQCYDISDHAKSLPNSCEKDRLLEEIKRKTDALNCIVRYI